MFHNPGGDCYWEVGQPKVYLPTFLMISIVNVGK